MITRIIDPNDPLVEQARERIWSISPAMAINGFGGDRLVGIACFAIALEAGRPVALASLSPTDEEGEGGPHIIAVWAEAEMLGSAGVAALRSTVEESLRRYQVAPTLIAVTPEEVTIAREAMKQGISLTLNDQSRFGFGFA